MFRCLRLIRTSRMAIYFFLCLTPLPLLNGCSTAIALLTKLFHIETELKMYYANPMILCHTHTSTQRMAQTKKRIIEIQMFSRSLPFIMIR